jgi:hypothetical protein
MAFSGSRICDPGSPAHIFKSLETIFLDKKYLNDSLSVGSNFFLYLFKHEIVLNYVRFVATKKDMTTNFYPSLLLFLLDPRSGMDKIRIRDNIPDLEHCWQRCRFRSLCLDPEH